MKRSSLITGTLLGTLLILSGCSLEPPQQSPHYTATAASPTATQHKAVSIAQQMLGTPYRYGGNTPQGFDCSGLVHYSYSRAGYPITRDSSSQFAQTIPIDPRDLRPGDLLFYNIDGKNGHVVIYAGDGRFIHAPSSGKRVSYGSMNDKYWRDRFVRAGRLR